MEKPILELKNISKSFIGVKALQNVNFSCRQGEVHILMGENGAGKSTILKILSGLYKPDAGTILLKGDPVSFRNPQEAQNAGIAMVYQELTVLPEMTVAQNIFLSNEPRNRWGTIDNKEIRQKSKEMLVRYKIDIDPDDLVGTLPIAKQQMVEILKILVRDPEIIILDEPTSALAREEVTKLYDIINTLIENGKTIIFISHRFEEIFHIGDRATVLKDGHFVATVNMKEITQEDLIKLMVGRPLKSIFPPKLDTDANEKVFEISNLNVENILYDISFDIKKGEVLGIAGLQGHGQTELLNSLAGVIHKNSGRIFINSKEVRIKNPIQAIRSGIALIPEDRKTQGLLLTLSVRENASVASLYLRQVLGFIKRKKENVFADDIIKRLSIKTPDMEQQVVNLSGGNQQKVVLGKGLAIKPKVLLFNEPTRGIDVETKQEFYKLMRNLAAEGVTVIMYSSDLMEVIGMSDRVLVMYEGRITAEINKDEINEENIMRGAVGLAGSGGNL
ncbi:sugar ABC transporter ATP-binding protein [Petroclostridium sp. X23]|uniref:sugar ABC transporter ATP-binding protein n=1 Tax=Petroclostridium sp. X23 TaxID=3045146 RepID=UPI0024AE74FF|nr:sugar ABC transporter ATP-binding protein [Petroclostridium sp. X23]WHH58178.1 sugar ABC transporter ATP-binding protein [Petroclostridium sp. X23]